MSEMKLRPPVPTWFWVVAVLGLAWNIFGVFQFLPTVNATVESMVQGGLTQAQAELYVGLPIWMTVAFAIGVFGGTLACVLLLLRRRAAQSVFAVSLIAYVVLYIGDMTLGVFAAFGTGQVVVLTTVVAIAAGLLWLSRRLPTATDC